jgi:hypothetical protein
VDYHARKEAALAHARLDGHERVTGERWEETKGGLEKLHRRISKAHDETSEKIDRNHGYLTRLVIRFLVAALLAIFAAGASAFFMGSTMP